MKNFSRKSSSALSGVLSPEFMPNDQSTMGFSGRTRFAKKWKTPSSQPCCWSQGITWSAQVRWRMSPKSEKPLPKPIEHHAPTMLPKRL